MFLFPRLQIIKKSFPDEKSGCVMDELSQDAQNQ